MDILLLLVVWGSITTMIFGLLYFNQGKEYLAGMHYSGKAWTWSQKYHKYRDKTTTFLIDRLSASVIKDLEKVGRTKESYVRFLILVPTGGFIAGSVLVKLFFHLSLIKCLLVGVVFFLLSVPFVRFTLVKELEKYEKDMVFSVPDLADSLKVSLIVGNTIEDALHLSLDFVKGPLQKIISDVVYRTNGELSLEETLDHAITRVDKHEVRTILEQIKNYSTMGIADRRQVFSGISETLNQINNDRSITELERIKIPLTMMAMAGFISLFLVRLAIPLSLIKLHELLNG